MTESAARKLAEQIRSQIPKIRGSLRFWGQWFDKPHGTLYVVKKSDSQGDILRLYFDDEEKLSVWSPSGLVVQKSTLRIQEAARVRWEWFYYGRPKTSSNLFFLDYARLPIGVVATTNVDWYKPHLKGNASEAAVEIL